MYNKRINRLLKSFNCGFGMDLSCFTLDWWFMAFVHAVNGLEEAVVTNADRIASLQLRPWRTILRHNTLPSLIIGGFSQNQRVSGFI